MKRTHSGHIRDSPQSKYSSEKSISIFIYILIYFSLNSFTTQIENNDSSMNKEDRQVSDFGELTARVSNKAEKN